MLIRKVHSLSIGGGGKSCRRGRGCVRLRRLFPPPPHGGYRVTAYPDGSVERVKQALFKGGIVRANKPEGVRNTPGIQASIEG